VLLEQQYLAENPFGYRCQREHGREVPRDCLTGKDGPHAEDVGPSIISSESRRAPEDGSAVLVALGAQARSWVVPSDMASVEPQGDKEVLGRDPKGSRGLMTAVGILAVVLVAYGAILVVSGLRPEHHRPEPRSGDFNIFANVENACDEDHGSLVTTDPHGTPMAFPTPDGPERFWCVSRLYLTSIGHRRQDPPPPVSEVPREFKWQWPSTTFGE
jgi:hypothetical protein